MLATPLLFVLVNWKGTLWYVGYFVVNFVTSTNGSADVVRSKFGKLLTEAICLTAFVQNWSGNQNKNRKKTVSKLQTRVRHCWELLKRIKRGISRETNNTKKLLIRAINISVPKIRVVREDRHGNPHKRVRIIARLHITLFNIRPLIRDKLFVLMTRATAVSVIYELWSWADFVKKTKAKQMLRVMVSQLQF